MIDLLNKVVKVSDVNDLAYYFPGFVVRQALTSLDYGDDIIYTGPLTKSAQRILDSCRYVATQGLYQFDFTNRKEKVKFVFSKWDREPTKQILDNVDVYDEDEFNYCCKVYWSAGRWPYKVESEYSLYALYQSSVESVEKFVRTFVEACDSYPVGIVEQSFLTFILRSRDVDEQNVSPQYKRLLKSFNNVSGSRVKAAVSHYIDSSITNRELRFIDFIYSLRGSS